MVTLISLLLTSTLVFSADNLDMKTCEESAPTCESQAPEWQSQLQGQEPQSCVQKLRDMEKCCYQNDMKACGAQMPQQPTELSSLKVGEIETRKFTVSKYLYFNNVYALYTAACKSYIREIQDSCQSDTNASSIAYRQAENLDQKQIKCLNENASTYHRKAKCVEDQADTRLAQTSAVDISCKEEVFVRNEKAVQCSEVGAAGSSDDDQRVSTASNDQSGNVEQQDGSGGNEQKSEEEQQQASQGGEGGGGGMPQMPQGGGNTDKEKETADADDEDDDTNRKEVIVNETEVLATYDPTLGSQECIPSGAELKCGKGIIDNLSNLPHQDDGNGKTKLTNGLKVKGTHYTNVVIAPSSNKSGISISSFSNSHINHNDIALNYKRIIAPTKLHNGRDILGD